MPATVQLKRILCSDGDAVRQLARLREQFNSTGEVLSPESRKLTQAVFGEPLPPARVVERVCNDVRDKGLSAVFRYTEQFDKVKLTPATFRVSPAELAAAHAAADPEFLETIRRIRENVLRFQLGLLHRDAELRDLGKSELHVRYRPLRRVGVCVPGGAAAYPSTLLMTVCPAMAAGVKEIAVVMPPRKTGADSPDLRAVCHELGVTEVYRIGGAQGVAALAYGVEGLPAVDMIVGPGNTFVALAKKHVFGTVAIDCIAGPSEIVVLADETAQPEYVAADLIAQAEHNPGVAVLVTWKEHLLDEVTEALDRQLARLSRGEEARESLERYGALVLARDPDEAVACVNDLATEHLHIQTRDPESLADRIDNAGAIFLGPFTPVAVGDYAAGPSHVLPTGGTARFASGLTANDFLRRSSVLSFTRTGLKEIAEDVVSLADKEGLTAHAASVSVRLNEGAPTSRRPAAKADKARNGSK
jgi:histidinol dehydrogenase